MADVKFSELTSLAASDVASDDILAIVDTGASTSKKLSIDNLFGAVPVNIAQTDATDATSSAGAVRTAGGVSMAKKLSRRVESGQRAGIHGHHGGQRRCERNQRAPCGTGRSRGPATGPLVGTVAQSGRNRGPDARSTDPLERRPD